MELTPLLAHLSVRNFIRFRSFELQFFVYLSSILSMIVLICWKIISISHTLTDIIGLQDPAATEKVTWTFLQDLWTMVGFDRIPCLCQGFHKCHLMVQNCLLLIWVDWGIHPLACNNHYFCSGPKGLGTIGDKPPQQSNLLNLWARWPGLLSPDISFCCSLW